MPKSVYVDHHDTANYIPMYHRTGGFTRHEREILRVPCQGVCVYTLDWPISSLQYVVDPHPDIYPPPHEDPSLIRDALFYERTQAKT
nr:hypothetical protein [Tanacetum cinerariifolium]